MASATPPLYSSNGLSDNSIDLPPPNNAGYKRKHSDLDEHRFEPSSSYYPIPVDNPLPVDVKKDMEEWDMSYSSSDEDVKNDLEGWDMSYSGSDEDVKDWALSCVKKECAKQQFTQPFDVLSAKVEILLPRNYDHVFGGIYTENSLVEGKTCLFDKKNTPKGGKHVLPTTKDRKLIMPEPIIHVLSRGDLIIYLDLMDSNTGFSIVKEKVTFSLPSGSPWNDTMDVWAFDDTQIIGNDIKVSVSWVCHHY